MPSSTAQYRFEFRLQKWATTFSSGLCGETRGFFVGFRGDGSVRRVYLTPPNSDFDSARKTALAEVYDAWFMFSPYRDEADVYYLEWLGLTPMVVAPWLGGEPKPAELEDVRDGVALEQWPDAWRVIVRG